MKRGLNHGTYLGFVESTCMADGHEVHETAYSRGKRDLRGPPAAGQIAIFCRINVRYYKQNHHHVRSPISNLGLDEGTSTLNTRS